LSESKFAELKNSQNFKMSHFFIAGFIIKCWFYLTAEGRGGL